MLRLFFFFAATCAPIVATAELLIYKGTEKEIVTGENNGLSLNWKLFLIVDHDTGNFARVRYASHNGTKRHFTLLQTNSHIVQVIGPNARMYTAITRIPTDCDAQEFRAVKGFILRAQTSRSR